VSWRAALIVLLLIAAGISGWAAWYRHAEEMPVVAGNGRPDYVLHDFEMVALDNEGRESFTLRAPSMLRDPQQRSMTIATPVFTLPDSQDHYWRVSSRQGWISPGGDELRLHGDVRVSSPPGDRPVAMRSEQLNVYPDRNVASSPLAVTVTEPGLTMRGLGFRADLDAKRFTILSQATARYVPTHR
jgi:lipopolysaccharide export system protein LptC